MRFVLSILFLTQSLILSQGAQAFTVTSLNLEWFGRGGDMHGTADQEYRQNSIRELMTAHLSTTDVLILQEIMDVDLLTATLTGWECRTYRAEDLDHQHVAACAKPGIILKDSTIETVRVSWGLRPAYRILVNMPGFKHLSIVGLHLKAGKESTHVRINQVKELLESIEAKGPMLIMGDFNTYPKERTGLEKDDVVMMDELFQPAQFKEVGGDQSTYLGFDGRTFDRVWQREVNVKSFAVRGPCQPYGLEQTSRYTLKSYYERFVSDHCPVSVEVETLP